VLAFVGVNVTDGDVVDVAATDANTSKGAL
jgi:hypothetical protein